MSGLEIIGLVAIVLLAAAGLVVLWFVRSFRKMMALASSTPPCRVNPEPEANPKWHAAGKIERFAEEFRALGFEEIGAFTIPEMSRMQMLAFLHPSERLYGVVYDHEQIGPTFDIACNFGDGTGITATNTTIGDTLDQRPGHRTLWLGKDRVREVFESLRQEAGSAPRLPVAAADFVSHFKKEYAESMNWRLKKGGVTREELRRQAEKDGQKLSEEQLEEAYSSLRESYLEEIREGCIAQYLDENEVSAEEWERRRWSVFAVPDIMDPGELLEALDMAVGLDEEQRHQLETFPTAFGEGAVDRVRRIMAEDGASLELQEVAEVEEPVHALILVAPDVDEAAGPGEER